MFVSGHFARKSFLPQISLPAYLAEILPPIQRLSFEIRVTSGDVIWPFDDVWSGMPLPPPHDDISEVSSLFCQLEFEREDAT